jgi:hypothetical protein
MEENNITKPKRVPNGVVMIFYCLSLLVTMVFAYRRPLYNWDMLGYMALVVQKDHPGQKEIHQITYSTAKENIPAEDFKALTGGEHRKMLSESPGAFFATLPFYAVKPLYIKMASLFHKAGLTLPMATVLPSIIFYFFIGLLLFSWLSRHLKLFWAFGLSIGIMYSGFMVFLARLSTPDCLSTFLLLSAFYFILEKPSPGWMFLFLLLSVYARLDNIIPAGLIVSFLYFTGKWKAKLKRKTFLLMLLVLAASYFLITGFTMRPFGWGALYYPAFATQLDLSHAYHSNFSFHAYISLVVSQLATALVFYHFIFFLCILLLILYSPAFKFRDLTFDQSFSLLLFLIILCRFILYPDLSDRFNVAYYLCFLVLFIKKYAGLLDSINSHPE